MFDKNPSLIYSADDGGGDTGSPLQIPLILMHDGGGTCFSYWCLNPLGRDLYGVHNPHYSSGKSWTGGIPEMARYYVAFIRRVIPRGPVILGGWSLGGILALEMARVLEEDAFLHVVGIVMVDSVCPEAFRAVKDLPLVPFKHQFGPNTREETKAAVKRCFAEARKMVGQYSLPSWKSDLTVASERVEGDEAEALKGWVASNGKPDALITSPPPVILLRAMDSVPAEPGSISSVDVARDDRLLGWGSYRADLVQEVVDIPGHHFNIFAQEYIDNVSEKISAACYTIEKMASVRSFRHPRKGSAETRLRG